MLKRVPIKIKLTMITAVASVLALLVASAGFLYYDLTTFRAKMSADLRTEAEVIAVNCSAGMAFHDKETVVEVLRSLRSRPQIQAAAAYSPEGKVFAKFVRTPSLVRAVPASAEGDSAHFDDGGLVVFRPIRSGNDVVGTLFIRSSMEEWEARRKGFSAIMGCLVLACLIVALLVGWRLQRLISVPLLELAATMRRVAREECYDQRVEKRSDDEIGELVDGFNTMLAEIEERDRALHEANDDLERRVSERSEALSDFFDNATVGLHWLAEDGTILRANRAELDMFGYVADAYVGRNIAEFHHDKSVINDILSRLAAGETLTSYEARMKCSDGSIKHVAIDANVLWQGDKFVHVRGFTRDLTAQKEAERAQREREQAERANLAKNDFLSRMSHELRTPMNSILGFSQIMLMEDLSDDHRDSVQHIVNAGTHLLKLINEVLDISRIESGNMAISNEAVNLSAVVREVLALVGPLASQKSVSLFAPAADMQDVFVFADHQRLCQVLLNLVSNAIKYNLDFGEVLVDATAENGGVKIRVTDTGLGIPAEKVPLIFTPFERLGAEKTATEGTGLGLALSKRLVEAMGGTIGIEGVRHGTCFYVELPVADSPMQVLKDPHLPDCAPVAPADQMLVLLIEDNLANVRVIEKLFASRPQFKLIVAMQGSIGLDLAREHRPDLVLLDLNLPDLHGEDLLTRLKAEGDLPVVIISADATPAQIRRSMDAGAVEYLTKPLNVQKFLGLLESLGRIGERKIA